MRLPTRRIAPIVLLTLLALGCSSSPSPESASPPPGGPPPSPPTSNNSLERGFTRLVSGAGDSVGSIPGAQDAPYRFRFRQISPPSDRFTFQDRDLSFYFKPSPDALHFQVENRQDRPVWIDWDRSTFYDPIGNTGKVAHSSTRWFDRFNVQTQTQIAGLGRYGDYLLPMESLVDPAGSPNQIHLPLLPQDTTSPQYTDKEFAVDLVFIVEDRPKTYSFRFKVASVIPQ